MCDVHKTWRGALERIHVPLSQLQEGCYRVEGQMSEEQWHLWCIEQGFKPEGGLEADLFLFLDSGLVDVRGTLYVTLQRTCVRTLQTFSEPLVMDVKERMLLKRSKEVGVDIQPEIMRVADYVLEHVLLQLEPYPLHPKVRHQPRGGLIWQDSLHKNEEKNPFYALKDLQESSKSVKCAPRLHQRTVSVVPIKRAS